MKLAVVGSRGWTKYTSVFIAITSIFPDEIVSGGAKGVDSMAEQWATLYHVPTKIFLPDWKKYGKRAGAIRNKQIVDYCDKLIAFWDGKSRGTLISIEMAQKAGKLLKVFRE